MRKTNLRNGLVATMAVGALLLAGCSQREAPTYGPAYNASKVTFSSSGLNDPTNGYEVTFDGRTVSEGQTTFSYTVTWTPSCLECPLLRTLSQFMLELPPCAPELDSYTPPSEGSILTSPYTGFEGIEWTMGYGEDPYTESFSVTFPGDVALGVVRGSLRTGSTAVVAEIPGPCDGFSIGGTVYTDTDSSGTQDPSESGIPNVTVSLDDGEQVVEVLTDAGGSYSFLKGTGTYTLSVGTATPASDFNENLAAQFDATGPLSRSVTVGPDSPHNNFGFRPSVESIIEAIDDSTLVTTGKTVRYWKKQLKKAMRHGEGDDDDDDDADDDDDDWSSDLVTGGPQGANHHHGRHADYNREELLAFIHSIEELALPTPYQFTHGCEIEQAYRILKCKSKDPVEVLRRELLATEFNHVSGKGLTTEFGLQIVLITWGEGLLLDATESGAPVPLSVTGEDPVPLAVQSPLEGAGTVFKKINGATSGGGTN